MTCCSKFQHYYSIYRLDRELEEERPEDRDDDLLPELDLPEDELRLPDEDLDTDPDDLLDPERALDEELLRVAALTLGDLRLFDRPEPETLLELLLVDRLDLLTLDLLLDLPELREDDRTLLLF